MLVDKRIIDGLLNLFQQEFYNANYNPNQPRDKNGKWSSINHNYEIELNNLLLKAASNSNENIVVDIGTVDKKLIKLGKKEGFEFAGYKHNIDIYGVKHTLKNHGKENRESPRGQIAIKNEDFKLIPEIIYKSDSISFTGKNKIGRETITYSKQFPDGIIYYVEEIRNKNKTLTLNTMYKRKRHT